MRIVRSKMEKLKIMKWDSVSCKWIYIHLVWPKYYFVLSLIHMCMPLFTFLYAPRPTVAANSITSWLRSVVVEDILDCTFCQMLYHVIFETAGIKQESVILIPSHFVYSVHLLHAWLFMFNQRTNAVFKLQSTSSRFYWNTNWPTNH